MQKCVILVLVLCIISILQLLHAKRQENEDVRRERAVRIRQTWNAAVKKVARYLKKLDKQRIPIEQRNLVLFHMVEFNGGKDSQDIPMNNVKLFVSALLQHTNEVNDQRAFYLFSVGSGSYNAFFKFLPLDLPNVAYAEWPGQAGEKDTPIRTSMMLGLGITSNFTSITVASDRVRGPLVGRHDGEWLRSFRHLLDNNNVGVVGSSISCDNYPHVQPHMYMFRSAMINRVVAASKVNGKLPDSTVSGLVHLFREGMTKTAIRLGYRISSVLTHARLEQPYFDGTCIPGIHTSEMPLINPTSWCNIKAEEVIFLKWGGVPLRIYSGVCAQQIQAVQEWMIELTISDKVLKRDSHLQLTLPETLHGGLMYELQRMYNLEMWKDLLAPRRLPSDVTKRMNNNVCFAVLVGKKHDYDELVRKTTLFLKVTMDGMIKSLLRQSNPYWSAYFVNIEDDDLFDARLREILFSVRDPRIIYDRRYMAAAKRLKSSSDKYQMFDDILHSIAKRPECKYLTITSGDNFYGSEVVEQVLAAKVIRPPFALQHGKTAAAVTTTAAATATGDNNNNVDLATAAAGNNSVPHLTADEVANLPRFKAFSSDSPLLPTTYSRDHLSSPYQPASSWGSVFTTAGSSDYGTGSGNSFSSSSSSVMVGGDDGDDALVPDVILNPLDSKHYADQEYSFRESMRASEEEYSERCIGIDAMTALRLLPYTVRPTPIMGRLNFAAVFFNRNKFLSDNIFFGNVTMPNRIPQSCMPCQDGYMVEFLVRNKHWQYARLPTDGLKSIVFHGPSPSLCISSGNVWFDYPSVNKVGCLAQKTVDLLRKQDIPERANFDWRQHNVQHKVCLRLTEHGFNNRDDLIFQ